MRYFIYSFVLVFILTGSVVYAGSLEDNIKNYHRVDSSFSTSGRLGPGALEELKKQGFKTVIDLRTRAEGSLVEQKEAIEVGLDYINISIAGAQISDKKLAKFTRVFDVAQKPVLVHCASGNRVGAMLSLYYVGKGMDTNEAFVKGRAAGMTSAMEKKIRANCKKCE